MLFVAHPALGQRLQHIRADNLADILLRYAFLMLRGHDHRGGAHGFAVFILQRNLAFGVRTQRFFLAGVARIPASSLRILCE